MKIAVVIRKDLGMRAGKVAVEVGHASVEAYRADPEVGERWYRSGQKKIVLKASDLNQLENIYMLAKLEQIHVEKIVDWGLTQVPTNTTTGIVIGPDDDEKIDKVVGHLSLW